jgi:hypothetical protein
MESSASASDKPNEVRPHYAVYRKDYQLFEILRPVYSKKDPAVIQKFGYDDGLAVSSWIVCKSAPESARTEKETILIKGKPVEYVYTGAELRPAPQPTSKPEQEAQSPIPIVKFLRSNHLPNTIKGIRVAYMDDIGPDYFTKKTPAGSKALHLVFRGEKAVVMNNEELVREQEEKEQAQAEEPVPEPQEAHVWVPQAEDDDFCDQFKHISFLSILCLFFLFAYYKNESRKYPYIPFKDVCHPDDAPFFMDPFSVAHP